jgi:hypothetical protein
MANYKKQLPIVRRVQLADGSVVSKILSTGKLPTANVELTPKTTKDLYGIVALLGSMYIIGGVIRIMK